MTNNSPIQLWEILVPNNEFDGLRTKIIPLEHHYIWDNFVSETVGGLTVYGVLTGKSRDLKDIRGEEMIPVRIACSSKQLKSIMEFTKKHYKQHSVMAYKISDTVVFM